MKVRKTNLEKKNFKWLQRRFFAKWSALWLLIIGTLFHNFRDVRTNRFFYKMLIILEYSAKETENLLLCRAKWEFSCQGKHNENACKNAWCIRQLITGAPSRWWKILKFLQWSEGETTKAFTDFRCASVSITGKNNHWHGMKVLWKIEQAWLTYST